MAEASSSSSGEPSGPGLGRAACLVTAASQGFGRSVARLVAARLVPGSLLLLAARSVGALGELEGELHAAYPDLRVQALPADLGADEGLQPVARDATTMALASSASTSLTTPVDWPLPVAAAAAGLLDKGSCSWSGFSRGVSWEVVVADRP
ncbi:hypothetical protein JRQ81_007746 [Phrynocephalus forsythii]|uniref:Sepiapterin reductase n=1 Tax=Phrynocephalus forsythii TaxID=171643 RepID=A0A9Q0Y539_9SAUR|nr:hypothetical protein JRQ81_007746 [Phrynocephalus forsythii]